MFLYGVTMPRPEVPQRFRYVADYLTRMPQQLDMVIELLRQQNNLLASLVKKETKVVVEEEVVKKKAELGIKAIEEDLIPIIKPIVTKTNQYTGIVLSKDFIVIPVVNAPVVISQITFYDDLSQEVKHDFAEDTNLFILRAENADIYYAPWSIEEKAPDKLTAGMGMIFNKSSSWKSMYLKEASPGGQARIVEMRYQR